MFRQLITSMFILAFFAQTFNKPFIILEYYTNTAAFAKNCINKARPKMKCHGKCQMMKKIQEEEKKEQQNEEQKTSYKSEVLSSKSFFAQIEYIPITTTQSYPAFSERAHTGIPLTIFHPPGA